MAKNIVVITISDTCSSDPTKDTSGPALVHLVKQLFPNAQIIQTILPDEGDVIEKELKYICDSLKVDLILTTGGTGLSSRDVTPEATKAVIDKEVPGISIAVTMESLKITPMAMISRAMSGIRKETLIINFPGSKKAATECFDVVKPVLSHALDLIKNDLKGVKETHKNMQGSDHVCPHKKNISNIDTSKVAFRLRESPYPMIEMAEAFRLVDELMQRWTQKTELLKIEEGLGRVVAEEVIAKEPLPPFPASVKDGGYMDIKIFDYKKKYLCMIYKKYVLRI